MLLVAALVIAAIVAALAALATVQRARFEDAVVREGRALFDAADTTPRPIDRGRLAALPPPVRRYLEQALGARSTDIRSVVLAQDGTIRLAPGQDEKPIAAVQYFTSDPPGFVWHGRVTVAPGVWVDARDRSANGVAEMLIKAESTFTLGRARGKELDEGAAMRVLGEMTWFPTSFLDERYVTWEPIDAHRAKGTLSVGGTRVSLTFTFDERGLPTRIDALRWRDVGGGKSELTPWTALASDWAMAEGVLVPHRVKATWHLEGGDYEALDLRVTSIDLDAAR